MKKKMTGFIVGTLMFTLIAGTAAFASESSNGAPSRAAEETKQAITIEDAAKIALEDAQVSETDAVIYKQIREYNDNMDIFEIDFLIPGQVKYEYEIAADTGKILENDKEAWEADDDREYAGLTAGKTADPENADKGLEEAAETAFRDAGVNKEDVIICKLGTDFENGREVYIVEFLQEGKAKYEYEIAAADGTIVFHEQEPWEKEDDYEYQGLLHPETVQEKNSGAETGTISKTEAKEIALRDAGKAENDVRITKCGIDFDDGVEKYEVEFRTADGYEYEYEIDVKTGKILDKDVELDD